MNSRFVKFASTLAVAGALVLSGGVAEAGGRSAPLVPVDITLTGTPALGSTVGFDVDLNGNWSKNPRVVVSCQQDGELVFATTTALGDTVKLGGDSSPWQQAGGPASCTAEVADYLFIKRQWVVTTFPGGISFTAAG